MNIPPTDHDSLFKRLFTTFFFDFLRLFFPVVVEFIDLDFVEFLDKETFRSGNRGRGRKKATDIVAKVRFRGREVFFLIHIENQDAPQADFARRMYLYAARLEEKYGLPVYPIAIFSYDSPQREEPTTYVIEFPDFTPLRFAFRAIQLNRLNWRDFLGSENPVASALMAKMQIAKKDRPKVKAQCLRLLATLKLDYEKMTLIGEFVDTYLELSRAEEDRFEQELADMEDETEEEIEAIMTSWERRGLEAGLARGMERGLAQGLEKGIEQGLEKGIEQGLEKGLQTTNVRQLTRRFGTLSEPVTERIQRLSIAQLENLSEALLDFASLAEAENWLAAQKPN